jgi:hypothetical protein
MIEISKSRLARRFYLLTPPDQQPKAGKSKKKGVLTYVLHLAPATLSGREVCPGRSEGCTLGCLNTAGRGQFDKAQQGRILRTRWYFADRAAFMARLVREIERAQRAAAQQGMRLALRLNGTSDIPWHRVACGEHASIMHRFPHVQFYDYTKVSKRLTRETLPANYHLTFSLCEDNATAAREVLAAGGNVAVVYRNVAARAHYMAAGFMGHAVIDGDETDARFLDSRNVIVGLYAKGRAKGDVSGFVRD